MNIFEQMISEFKSTIDKTMMLKFANYKLTDGGVMGKEASFLLWGDSRKDTEFFWTQETWQNIRPEYVVFGMNQSKYIDSNFGIFHKEVAGDALKEISGISNSMKGAIILDLIKLKKKYVTKALKNPEAYNKAEKAGFDLHKIDLQENDANGIFLASKSSLVKIIWDYSEDLRKYTKKMLKEKIKIIQNVFELPDPPIIVGGLGNITRSALKDIEISAGGAFHPSGKRAVGTQKLVQSFSNMSINGIIKRILSSKNIGKEEIARLDYKNIDLDKLYSIKSELEYLLNLLVKQQEADQLLNSDSRPWPPAGPERVKRMKEKNNSIRNKKENSDAFEDAKIRLCDKYGVVGLDFTIDSINDMLFNILQFEDAFGELTFR